MHSIFRYFSSKYQLEHFILTGVPEVLHQRTAYDAKDSTDSTSSARDSVKFTPHPEEVPGHSHLAKTYVNPLNSMFRTVSPKKAKGRRSMGHHRDSHSGGSFSLSLSFPPLPPPSLTFLFYFFLSLSLDHC